MELILYWKRFLIGGGRVNVLEWKSLSHEDQEALAQAGRIIRAENVVAAVAALRDEGYAAALVAVAEETADFEEQERAAGIMAVAREVLDEKRRLAVSTHKKSE